MKKDCILCDIDGVLLDSRKWHEYLPKSNKREEWNEFQKYYYICKPNPIAIDLIKSILKMPAELIFFTAREDNNFLRLATKEQLYVFSNSAIDVGKNCTLIMRPKNNFNEDSLVKEIMLKTKVLPFYNPILAIDDNKGNIEMFKKYKIDTIEYTINN